MSLAEQPPCLAPCIPKNRGLAPGADFSKAYNCVAKPETKKGRRAADTRRPRFGEGALAPLVQVCRPHNNSRAASDARKCCVCKQVASATAAASDSGCSQTHLKHTLKRNSGAADSEKETNRRKSNRLQRIFATGLAPAVHRLLHYPPALRYPSFFAGASGWCAN